MNNFLNKAIDWLCIFLFFIIISILIFKIPSRIFNFDFFSISSASEAIVNHANLWICFVGAIIAARSNKLLSVVREPVFNSSNNFEWPKFFVHFFSVSTIFLLSISYLTILEFDHKNIAPFIPTWFAKSIIPIGLILMWIQMLITSSSNLRYRLSLAFFSIIPTIVLFYYPYPFESNPIFLWFIVFFSTVLVAYGLPLFIYLALLPILFYSSEPQLIGSNMSIIGDISDNAYTVLIKENLAAIPMFTLAGYILAESNISERLINFFKASVGWIPGSTVLIVIFLSTFFTALTGGSGVTILALGAVLFPILVRDGYSKRFSLGLITTAGSLGLLFPPSLPAIIYSVTAEINPLELFREAFIPAIFLMSIMFFYGLYMRPKNKKTEKFNLARTIKAANVAKWEILIPILIVLSIYTGFATLVESAAILALYVLIVELYIFKDIKINDLPKIVINCAKLLGGILIILGFAYGLTQYFIDIQFEQHILEFVKSSISSKIIFLLILNILLLIIGCLMDVYSAIIVVVPLIAPIALQFGIDPIHLAIIFIANLELGYITPPVGMNLYLSSFRFDKDMPTIYRATLPFFFIRLIGVLIITYIPLFFY